ncbi:MAG TPA: DNA polymerase III subunit [bacterium]|nr:DNA polymerase III subunit [bacterium]
MKGNEKVKKLLSAEFRERRMAGSYLFSGPRGVGKKLFALWFARLIQCSSPKGDEPCGECHSCKAIMRGTDPDVVLIEPLADEGKRLVVPTLKIETIRENLIRKSSLKSWQGRWKIFIIDEAHTLTEDAGNLLLKTLEEPPEKVLIILVTHLSSKLLPTVRSRLRRVEFETINWDAAKEFYLSSGWTPEELERYAPYFDGTVAWLDELKDLGLDEMDTWIVQLEESRRGKEWRIFFDIIEKITRLEKKRIYVFFKYFIRKKEEELLASDREYELEKIWTIAQLLYRQRDPGQLLQRIYL